MNIWILRKHPPHPYYVREALEAFTIIGVYDNLLEPQAIALKHNNNKQAYYFYSVKKLQLTKKKPT